MTMRLTSEVPAPISYSFALWYIGQYGPLRWARKIPGEGAGRKWQAWQDLLSQYSGSWHLFHVAHSTKHLYTVQATFSSPLSSI